MKIHIVKQGDSLFELSKKYNVSLQSIIEANPQITNPDKLYVGDKVKIPSQAVTIGNGGSSNVVYNHTVKEGDTLWNLSKTWGIPLQKVIDANPQLSNPDVLTVGEIINIPSHGSGANSLNLQNNQGESWGKKGTAPIKTELKPSTKAEQLAPKAEQVAPKAEQLAPKAEQVAPKAQQVAPNPNLPKAQQVAPNPNLPKAQQIAPNPNLPKAQQIAPNPQPLAPKPVEPIKFDVKFESVKIEELYTSPLPQVETVKKPCGCGQQGPQLENAYPYMHYPVETPQVASYYDFPQVHPEKGCGCNGENEGYPGISNLPANPWMYAQQDTFVPEVDPYLMYGHMNQLHQGQMYSPEEYENVAPYAYFNYPSYAAEPDCGCHSHPNQQLIQAQHGGENQQPFMYQQGNVQPQVNVQMYEPNQSPVSNASPLHPYGHLHAQQHMHPQSYALQYPHTSSGHGMAPYHPSGHGFQTPSHGAFGGTGQREVQIDSTFEAQSESQINKQNEAQREFTQVQISESSDIKKSDKKTQRSGRSGESSKKGSQSRDNKVRSKARQSHNPWIND